MGRIKAFADSHRIAVLLVHHVRKMPDSDPFNMVSGSVGIIGAVDSMYVLEKDKRTENKATLHVTGRDIEDMQLLLEFDRDATVWRFVSYLSGDKGEDSLCKTIATYLSSRTTFTGTATDLLDGLKEVDSSIAYTPNSLTRAMKEQALTLAKRYHIAMKFTRTKNVRQISLSAGDDDNGNTCGGKPETASPAPAGDGDSKNTCRGRRKKASPTPKGDDTPTEGVHI